MSEIRLSFITIDHQGKHAAGINEVKGLSASLALTSLPFSTPCVSKTSEGQII
ncbi:hypothetical protein [uncultured Cyclobacterium sp.]|uniref:hypothetical protein n=1 Tax=uncultured Cyclobacterium sp. TaxID=453820 RepID=UPI0030ECB06C